LCEDLERTDISGAEHIIWALDYPYVPFQTCSTEFLMNADLTDEQKEMIAYKNAEKRVFCSLGG
jgi:predicted TIM-barrel fold metal-dependent hydrolase